ncbi:unnamed protein product [Polarella glacialis]|uniref:Uncharacterized protein n=1 Tax=Polarella glacialis TaxID=89957 RepID=A0A813JAD2_POLGL|nr:unnamed protein product [Polarella glacialis]
MSPVGEVPSEPPPLLPSPLESSPEQEKFRQDYRRFRAGEAFGAVGEFKDVGKQTSPAVQKAKSLKGKLKTSFQGTESRGLGAMQFARFNALVPARSNTIRPIPTPPVPPHNVEPPLESVIFFEDERGGLPKGPPKTMSQAWAVQNENLARSASAFSDARIKMPWWLSLFFGFRHSRCRHAIVMPLYTTAIFCCTLAAVAVQLVQMRDPSSLGGRFGNAVIFIMGICAAAFLLQLNFRRPGRQSAVHVTSEIFMNNVMLPDYVDLWLERSRRSRLEVAFLWFLSVAAETAVVLWRSDTLDPGKAVVHLVVFATVATLISALSLYLLLVCSAQAAMVDHYSATAAELPRNYEVAVLGQRWDQIQAILRRSAQCLTPCLLILTLSPVVVVAASIVELAVDNGYNAQMILWELIPKTFGLLGIIRVLSQIGEVTGNCDRLPVFLNSLLLGDGFNQESSRLIHFIKRSKAGFYIFDTKVDYTVMSKV